MGGCVAIPARIEFDVCGPDVVRRVPDDGRQRLLTTDGWCHCGSAFGLRVYARGFADHDAMSVLLSCSVPARTALSIVVYAAEEHNRDARIWMRAGDVFVPYDYGWPPREDWNAVVLSRASFRLCCEVTTHPASEVARDRRPGTGEMPSLQYEFPSSPVERTVECNLSVIGMARAERPAMASATPRSTVTIEEVSAAEASIVSRPTPSAPAPPGDTYTCAICMERLSNYAMPCGHLACGDCLARLDACHVCRAAAQPALRLYA